MIDNADEAGAMIASERGGSSLRVYLIVVIVAALAHTFSFLATPLWVYPDSIDYIELAGGIVSRGDWSNELFLIRPPGYPIFLAIVFKIFGEASPVAIQVLQHAMGVGLAVLTVALSLCVTPRRSVALIAGVFCSLSLQVLAYCNMPLTEIPFALAFMGATYFLIRFWQAPHWRLLVACSVLAGVAYVVKPMGVLLYGVFGIVICMRVFCDLKNSHAMRDAGIVRWGSAFLRRSGAGLGVVAIPTLLIVSPWMIQSAYSHASNGTSRCLDYVLYTRALELDKLDVSETKSAAMLDIRSVVSEAMDRGMMGPEADFRENLTVISAYRRVRGLPFTESTEYLGRAGLDVMLEHPQTVAINTVKYVWWMLLAPDPVYRFVPGGVAGVEGQRASTAEFFDLSTYSVGAGSWERTLEKHASYLPLSTSGRVATDGWKGIKSVFRSWIDRGPSPIGVRDSLYEEFIVVCLLGGSFLVFVRRNGPATILFFLLFLYIGISSFFAGPQTRYVVVVKPILFVWAGVSIVAIFDFVAIVVRRVFSRRHVSNNASDGRAQVA